MAFPNEQQRIILVTGKGGVGKSTVAAAIAKNCAAQGRRTLLVELGDQSYYSRVLNLTVGYQPQPIQKHLDVALWSGEGCLKEYVLHLVKIRKIVDLFFSNRVMKTFIRAAPALKELAILGKITSGIRCWGPKLEYDIVVVDAYATGHFLALLKAPLGISELVESGPMGQQTRSILGVLKRPDLCHCLVVTIPEELPMTETVELSGDLHDLLGYRPMVTCNKFYTPSVSIELIRQSADHGQSVGEKKFGEFLCGLLSRQSEQLGWLEEKLGKVSLLPFVLEPHGRDVIAKLAHAVGERWKSFSVTVES